MCSRTMPMFMRMLSTKDNAWDNVVYGAVKMLVHSISSCYTIRKKCIHEPRACPHALSGGCPAQVGSSYDSSRRIRPVCATSAPDSHHLHGHGVSERTRSWDYFRFFSRAEHLAHEKRCWPHSPHTTECGQHLSLSHQWLTQEEKLKKAYAVFATPTTSRC